MIQLSLFAFLALLEIMAVLVALLGLLGIMVWRMRRTPDGNRIQFIDATDEHPTPSLYLDSEAARTRTFVESLRNKPKLQPAEPALRSALRVRGGLLRYESELARHPVAERDPALWTVVAQAVDATLMAEGYSTQPAQPVSVYGEDTATREVMVAQQTRTIEHLREYIQQLLDKLGHQPLPDDGIVRHMDELERANRELNQCVIVLEDENGFLRDQIAALLKLEPAASVAQANAASTDVKP